VALRVGFVIDTLSLPAGGTEGQLVQLLEGLDRGRFEPMLYCLQGSQWLRTQFRAAPAQVLDLTVRRSPALWGGVRAFADRLRQDRIDVLQTHFRDANFAGVLAARVARTPVVISTRRGVPYWQGRLELAVLRWLNRSVDCFLANSQATRDRYAADEGFDARRCEVIYNGLSAQRFALDASARLRLRAELGLGAEQPLVGIVANLRSVKGIDVFVRAAALVHARVPEARFVVVGQGAESAALRQLADSLGLAERLQLLGARADVADLLSAFDVGVLASHFESFSNAILEYLAAGLPVVATQVGGAAEAVGKEHGFLVEPGQPESMADAIQRLLRHPGGARAFRRESGLPEQFSLQHMVAAHEALYSRLALNANGPS
jgi:glycosyltransferase involved in cell wall biosynthesis